MKSIFVLLLSVVCVYSFSVPLPPVYGASMSESGSVAMSLSETTRMEKLIELLQKIVVLLTELRVYNGGSPVVSELSVPRDTMLPARHDAPQTPGSTTDSDDEETDGPSESETESGIKGTVLRGPVCPVQSETPEPGCKDQPTAADLIVRSHTGGETVREFSSDSNGSFTVSVPPGSYDIVSGGDLDKFFRCSSDHTVVVQEGKFTTISVSCDTGMR